MDRTYPPVDTLSHSKKESELEGADDRWKWFNLSIAGQEK